MQNERCAFEVEKEIISISLKESRDRLPAVEEMGFWSRWHLSNKALR